MIRVTIFNEYVHEQEYENIRRVYPEGIHGCLREALADEDIVVRTATFEMEEHGLTEEVLADTDVLIYWSHAKQDEFSDRVAERIRSHVLAGMGLIALHSAHFSKMMKLLLGTTMSLSWRENDSEKLWCIAPTHPIAAGVPIMLPIPHEEMYGEFFDIPKPDDVVFLGTFSGGEVFRSGCTFTRGYGKIFYFQPGHEEYPIYYMPEVRRILKNAVAFCKPVLRLSEEPGCRQIVRD